MICDSLHDRFIPDAIDHVFRHDYADHLDVDTLSSAMMTTVAYLAHVGAD
jgi:hypothetical protein